MWGGRGETGCEGDEGPRQSSEGGSTSTWPRASTPTHARTPASTPTTHLVQRLHHVFKRAKLHHGVGDLAPPQRGEPLEQTADALVGDELGEAVGQALGKARHSLHLDLRTCGKEGRERVGGWGQLRPPQPGWTCDTPRRGSWHLLPQCEAPRLPPPPSAVHLDGLKGAQRNVGDELGRGRARQIDQVLRGVGRGAGRTRVCALRASARGAGCVRAGSHVPSSCPRAHVRPACPPTRPPKPH